MDNDEKFKALLSTLESNKHSVNAEKSSSIGSSLSDFPINRKGQNKIAFDDDLDFSVLKYGVPCSLQGPNRRYLEAEEIVSETKGTSFSLGVRGQGIGESSNMIIFVNPGNKEDQGNVEYGSTVSLRFPFAKDKYLGSKDSKIGFYRPIIGQDEKWVILKYTSSKNPSDITTSRENKSGVGSFVRVGDSILLLTSALYQSSAQDIYNRSGSSVMLGEQMLCLDEGSGGSRACLIHRSGRSLGEECWKIELFNIPSPSDWMSRPYLSGKFLLIPQNERNMTKRYISDPPPLFEFSLLVQEGIMIRELLLALAGIEGQYVRVVQMNLPENDDFVFAPKAVDKGKKLSPGNMTFSLDQDSMDASLSNQVRQLLPLCDMALQIKYFLKVHSRYEYGLVSQTVVAQLQSLFREFDILIAQLEYLHQSNKLSLQKMIFLLQPARISLQILHRMAVEVFDSAGGSLLDKLYSLYMQQGDEQSKKVVQEVLIAAANPFLEMLSLWIYRGELNDRYNEFMIQEDISISKEALAEDFNAQYWENRYSLKDINVPRFLSKVASKVLITGKYLNVVRDCVGKIGEHDQASTVKVRASLGSKNLGDGSENGKDHGNREGNNDDECSNQKKTSDNPSMVLSEVRTLSLELQSGFSSLWDRIDEAYGWSSRFLLFLLEKYGIHSHFSSLRKFFLLEHGDFFIQFMDLAEDELRKDVKDISISRVQHLLQTALLTSTLSSDSHREDLSCSLATHNLLQHLLQIQRAGDSEAMKIVNQGLKGQEALTFDYHVQWPVSIVLSRRSITKYQLLSRLLYVSKQVERRLLLCWLDHQTTKNLNVRSSLGPAYVLRQKMLHFIQNFVYYMTVEVISPKSHDFTKELVSALDVDEVLRLHEQFLDSCLKECLLASNELLQIVMKVMTTCLLFSDSMQPYLHLNEYQDNELLALPMSHRDAGGSLSSSSVLNISSTNRADDSEAGISLAMKLVSNGLRKQKSIRNSMIDQRSNRIRYETSHESFIKTLQRFVVTFDDQMKEFLLKLLNESHRHQPQLANLCVRLDYNVFYSGKFEDSQRSSFSL